MELISTNVVWFHFHMLLYILVVFYMEFFTTEGSRKMLNICFALQV